MKYRCAKALALGTTDEKGCWKKKINLWLDINEPNTKTAELKMKNRTLYSTNKSEMGSR